MRKHSQIVRDAGAQAVADLTGASIHTVRSWIQRESIPAEHWAVIADKDWASLDELAQAVAKRAA